MLAKLFPEKLVLNVASTIMESFKRFKVFNLAFLMFALKLKTGSLGFKFTAPSKLS
ncbi:hypothetical protein D9M68_608780 [compost metagenome]